MATNEIAEPDYLACALAYAAKGWHVFPCFEPGAADPSLCACGRDCGKNKAKHPRTKNGLLDATTDADKIRAWWEKWPRANVAVRTGKESGIIVLDVDGELGRQSIKGLNLPVTATVLTGRGFHYYFKHPGGHVTTKTGLFPGVDIRGDGGYVLAPPSRHISGKKYTNAYA